ncbi:hypothetical protein [Silvania hatchlandensis]|uniref:Uncharacterized protein n=1 Tax=Silvania hatchlandensis TaxID=2926469 RepID=A0A9J6Q0Y8_9ENTR|nr:hypothetical protein [Silvania hatchlandensis]MCU6662914.1 hypothetical protein [Silvania hatchlandensis]
MLANDVAVLHAATVVTAHRIHSRCAVVSCLGGYRSGSHRVGGIRHHGSAFYRVKDNPGNG